MEEVYIASSM